MTRQLKSELTPTLMAPQEPLFPSEFFYSQSKLKGVLKSFSPSHKTEIQTIGVPFPKVSPASSWAERSGSVRVSASSTEPRYICVQADYLRFGPPRLKSNLSKA